MEPMGRLLVQGQVWELFGAEMAFSASLSGFLVESLMLYWRRGVLRRFGLPSTRLRVRL